MDRLRKEAKVESVKRIVTSLSLDGKRLTAEIDVEFVRELGLNTAEAIGDQVFAIVDSILGEQIVQSQVAIKPSDIEERIYARLGSTTSKVEQVRVHRLRVAAPGAPQSRPQGAGQARPTPPAFPGARATPPPFPRARATPPPFPGARATPPPFPSAAPTSAPSSGERRAAPAASSSRAPYDALTQSMVPSVKPRQSSRPASRSSSRPAARSVHPPPVPGTAAPTARTHRATVPAGESPEGADWSRTVQQAGPFSGRMIRDAAAYALITVLGSAPASVDKWAIFEGRGASAALRQEVAACFAAAVYMAARGAGASHRDAVGFVNAASRQAALADMPSPADVGRYISSPRPADELSARMAKLLGGETEASHFTQALSACHKTVSARLREAIDGAG
jgi:hypothetical protein